MAPDMEIEHDCPCCEATVFYRSGSTQLHLGEKVKWTCTGEDCDYGFVRIGDTVDSSTAHA